MLMKMFRVMMSLIMMNSKYINICKLDRYLYKIYTSYISLYRLIIFLTQYNGNR